MSTRGDGQGDGQFDDQRHHQRKGKGDEPNGGNAASDSMAGGEPGDEEALKAVFRSVAGDDELEPSHCALALAAAELVAGLRGRPSERLPESVSHWISARAHPVGDDLIRLARQAVERVRDHALLTGLDAAFEDLERWEYGLRGLLARLEPA